ncbi:MAG: SMI1/KNR4 family protein [[Eubacterium] sulci]|nr:SMI1/KNR4 family protein [[Eubacterium] sulci]
MCNVILEKYYDRIKAAYETSVFTEGICLETEEKIKQFEAKYAPIPVEYRWLLLNFGGCYLAEPWIFTLKELEENYTIFVEAYEEYMSECEHGPAFSIGGLGDGSIVFIDVESGKVRGYNNDYADLEDIAESFPVLVLNLVEQVEYFADKI